MMTIRGKILLLLLPTMIFFILGLSFLSQAPVEMILGAIILLLLLLFIIAKIIAKPIEELKNLAHSCAAGNYETTIEVTGPKEIVELTNTINTMSACLKEQITRVQENALMKERMYGEYECAALLQNYMLRRVIENHPSKELAFKSLDLLSDEPRGLLLTIEGKQVQLREAKNPGFQGMFELLLSQEESAFLKLSFDQTLSYEAHEFPPPFVWDTLENTRLEEDQNRFSIQSKDLIFLYNQAFLKHFTSENNIHAWFGKVLRHFAKDGLETVAAMLEKELLFFSRKRSIEEEIHLICIEVK